jgi:hypothetical protein
MKRIITIILALLIAGVSLAVPKRQEYGGRNSSNAAYLLGGEHAPLIYSSSGTCSQAGGAYTTDWMQIGYAATQDFAAGDSANKRIFEINPEKFTLTLGYKCAGAGDTARISSARFEVADSSSAAVPFWCPDSANLFIASGNYNRVDYGVWTFEPHTASFPDSVRREMFPLKILQGAYVRLVYETTTTDTVTVSWTLKGEN